MLYEEIASSGYEMSSIKPNDVVPVTPGTHVKGVENCRDKFIADLSSFESFFQSVDKAVPKIKAQLDSPDKLKWKNSVVSEIDNEALAHMIAFILVFEKELRSQVMKSVEERNSFYRNNTPRLSEVFSANNAACVECATLSQYYMENRGFDIKMISGRFLTEQNRFTSEPSEDHTFNILKSNDRLYIFDAAKRNLASAEITKAQEKQIEARKNDHEKKDNLTMIETKSFFGDPGAVTYYGFGRGSIKNPNSWLSRNNAQNIILQSNQNV